MYGEYSKAHIVEYLPSNCPAFWPTTPFPKVYAREEWVVDWSSVVGTRSRESGMDLRYGPRKNWHLKNMAEHGSSFVYRVGPPPPPPLCKMGSPPRYPRNKKITSQDRKTGRSSKHSSTRSNHCHLQRIKTRREYSNKVMAVQK
jgi:hypothetical protein